MKQFVFQFKQTNMDKDSISITCKYCKKSYSIKKMVEHVLKAKKCKGNFSDEQILSIKVQYEEMTEGSISITCRNCQVTYPMKSM